MNAEISDTPSALLLWSESQRPVRLQECLMPDITRNTLEKLVQVSAHTTEFAHLLVHGPSGAGKHTIVDAFLNELNNGQPLVREHKVWSIPTLHPSKTLDVHTIQSRLHVHLNPSEIGTQYDRLVVQYVVQKMSQSQLGDSALRFVVLDEVERLSSYAQDALRRTMETCFDSTCRLILICRTLIHVKPALRSRCLLLRIAAPEPSAVKARLQQILVHQGIDEVRHATQVDRVVEQCQRNWHKAIRSLQQACDARLYPSFTDERSIVPAPLEVMTKSGWQQQISDMAQLLATSPTVESLQLVRLQLQQIVNQCHPTSLIFTHLMDAFLTHRHDSRFIEYAAQYEYHASQGSKPMIHLEAFVTQCAAIFADQADSTTA